MGFLEIFEGFDCGVWSNTLFAESRQKKLEKYCGLTY